MYWAFAAGWLLMAFWQVVVYPTRKDKGYLGRLQRRITNKIVGPPRITLLWLATDIVVFIAILWPLSMLLGVLLTLIGVNVDSGTSAWITLILRILDDVINGEDDGWKKRWEAAKNKVKWLWTPAMEPASKGGTT